jgi:phosphatidylinositol-3,4,5-trisphosphate 3-phosphatase/dual-specificity protein phosphatase PTEN
MRGRSDVLRFLEPYAPHYRIFNLCPLYENSYDPAAFRQGDLDRELEAEEEALGGPVERYPWPDHHPPPLSLMRVMTEGVKRWYLQDERNVVVIHCKVRPGRDVEGRVQALIRGPSFLTAGG